jgi:hypothetical protein
MKGRPIRRDGSSEESITVRMSDIPFGAKRFVVD